MDQLTSLFESPEYTNKIERYNWFTTYATDPLAFGSGALNIPNWEYVGEGVGCNNRGWVANAKPTYSWGIEEIHECVAPARANPNCYEPLRLSFDFDNCYCAMDECATVSDTWGGMKTFRELISQTYGASALSVSGEQYNNFGTTTGTNAPTFEPTVSVMSNVFPCF